MVAIVIVTVVGMPSVPMSMAAVSMFMSTVTAFTAERRAVADTLGFADQDTELAR